MIGKSSARKRSTETVKADTKQGVPVGKALIWTVEIAEVFVFSEVQIKKALQANLQGFWLKYQAGSRQRNI